MKLICWKQKSKYLLAKVHYFFEKYKLYFNFPIETKQ